jgi:chorismate synthase
MKRNMVLETIVEVEEVRHVTASRVVGGAIAKQMLPDINAYVSSVGPIFLEKPYQDLDFSTENNLLLS